MLHTVADLKPGESAKVRKLDGQRGHIARLAALGFTIGAPIKVLRKNARGPLLVSLRGTQIALGSGEASGILVGEAEKKGPLPNPARRRTRSPSPGSPMSASRRSSTSSRE